MKQKHKNTLAFWIIATTVYVLTVLFIAGSEEWNIGGRAGAALGYFCIVGFFTGIFYSEQKD